MMFGLIDHASYVPPLPRNEVPVEGGHIYPKVSQTPHLVVHRSKAPDDQLDVAVSPGTVAGTVFGHGTAPRIVLKVSDVIMKSCRQNILRLCEGGQVKDLQLLVVYCTCVESEQI